MKITNRTPKVLVLEDKPSMQSLLSYSLLGAGLILIMGDFYRHVERQTLFWIGILLALGGGICSLRFNEFTRSVFDKDREKLVIYRKPPFRKLTAESYSLSEIGKIQIESPERKKGKREVFRITLELVDGTFVPLARTANTDYSDCETLAKRIQYFLGEEVAK